MTNRAKKQHYIPQLLLKHFCVEDRESLWVFDKQSSREYLSAVKDVASENYFNDVQLGDYTISFENHLEFVEAKAAPVLEKIIVTENVAQLTPDEQSRIIAFLIVQMFRGKGRRASMKQSWELACEKLGGRENAVRVGLPEADEQMDKLAILKNIPKFIDEFAPHFISKLWMLQHTPKAESLLLGDEAIVLDNSEPRDELWGNLGIACKGIEIYLPLTPNLLLAVLCPSIRDMMTLNTRSKSLFHSFESQRFINALEGGKPFLLNQQNVVRMNALQIAMANRFIFSKKCDFTAARQIIAKHPSLMSSPRYVS